MSKANEWIISKEILDNTELFTLESIIDTLRNKFHQIVTSVEDFNSFVEEKIISFCNIGLLTFTGIYYYVN